MNVVKLKAPFPYFGGKSRIAPLVWDRLGDVSNYLEPFAGSCAVLLARPQPFDGVETVNDISAYLTNFWRAVARDPEAVAAHADYPVSELDLHARHRWLVLSPEAVAFRERLRVDPDYFDAKIAGWWCWGACCWIGGEWCRYTDGPGRRPALSCEGEGIHNSKAMSEALPDISGDAEASGRGVCASAGHKKQPQKKPRTEGDNRGSVGKGVHAGSADWTQRPVLDGIDRGIHAQSVQLPDLSSGGCGIAAPKLSEQLPRMGNDVALRAGPHLGEGRPQLGDAYDVGRGVNGNGKAGTCEQRRAWLLDWFGRLQDRFRLVRICCGHWLRVCGSESVTTRLGITGIFLDPPYPLNKAKGGKSRSGGLYQGDDSNNLDKLRDEVLAYCIERGSSKEYRIALCCYEGDGYEPLEALGWEAVSWQANGGYGNAGKNKGNRERERIYFSPFCAKPAKEVTLFDTLPAGGPEEAKPEKYPEENPEDATP